jgi:hypothetical protein
MIGRMAHLITEGQFIQLRGHGVRDHLYAQWHKVTRVEGDTLHLVNRHGQTTRVSIRRARDRRWNCMVWEPGDSREDMAPVV